MENAVPIVTQAPGGAQPLQIQPGLLTQVETPPGISELELIEFLAFQLITAPELLLLLHLLSPKPPLRTGSVDGGWNSLRACDPAWFFWAFFFFCIALLSSALLPRFLSSFAFSSLPFSPSPALPEAEAAAL